MIIRPPKGGAAPAKAAAPAKKGFSLPKRAAAKSAPPPPPAASSSGPGWVDFAFGGLPATKLTPTAAFVSVNQSKPEHHSEPMALELHVGHSGARSRLLVFSVPGRGLGISMKKLRNLGANRIGGLLGTEKYIATEKDAADPCSVAGKRLWKMYKQQSTEYASENPKMSLIQDDGNEVYASASW